MRLAAAPAQAAFIVLLCPLFSWPLFLWPSIAASSAYFLVMDRIAARFHQLTPRENTLAVAARCQLTNEAFFIARANVSLQTHLMKASLEMAL